MAFQAFAFQPNFQQVAPVLIGQIPDISVPFDSGTHQFDLSDYFAVATSYAIDPAIEAGWTFNTASGLLEVDTNVAGTFGPFTVTASNDNGSTESNEFTVHVGGKPYEARVFVVKGQRRTFIVTQD